MTAEVDGPDTNRPCVSLIQALIKLENENRRLLNALQNFTAGTDPAIWNIADAAIEQERRT